MAVRPCQTCGTPTTGTHYDRNHCPTHQRDRNLARSHLPHLIETQRATCQICGHPITGPRGTKTPDSPSIDHADGDAGNNHPRNLLLVHLKCNAAKQHPIRRR